MDKLVLASRNKNKIAEMKALVSDLGIKVYSALDFPELEEVDEDQDTLEGNALKKARYVHQHTGLPSLSDDTGLEVDALGGAPGVYSARYAGEKVTYQDNVLKLLREMNGKEDRAAQFRTVVALVTAENEHTFEGVCKGVIIDHQRGEKGFGYDPVFLPQEFDQTFAELDSKVKNEISHRGRAIQKFISFLKG
ncbi:MAG: RdgB/HAM1 family non-canonical purine NTP pyrophosphatase [Balneolaceae bacterium]|nr:RdgB/HAM1 family non-canonical purine NTP pyrophosphatase [Balneolaceae bacterium]MBO6544948.1 RdgB/HAM1 family non-canonical purine NTP pyrophosphatase [Balneolaceae bacterium]MBO6646344.1 RdgB/HAM1 family non-canonical purine NTP pyrophosphatase [Balneolaceae bacterium]